MTANITPGSKNATIIASGDSTVPVTINASMGEFVALADGKGSMIVNPGHANATVIGTNIAGSGSTTLFGGMGSVVVADGIGDFTGGAAGGNLMFTGTVPGSATLRGGGEDDLLFAGGSNQFLIAGGGKSTLVGRWTDDGVEQSTGGHQFLVGAGFTTVFGAQSGGNVFLFAGLGSALIDGRDETAGGQARNTYQEFAQPGGTHLIGDFQSGLDVFVYSGGTDATIEFFNPGALDSPFGAQAGTRVVTPGGTTYLFFDTGADGIQDVKATDVFKI